MAGKTEMTTTGGAPIGGMRDDAKIRPRPATETETRAPFSTETGELGAADAEGHVHDRAYGFDSEEGNRNLVRSSPRTS